MKLVFGNKSVVRISSASDLRQFPNPFQFDVQDHQALVVLARDIQVTIMIDEVVSAVVAAGVTWISVGQLVRESLASESGRLPGVADVDRFDRLSSGKASGSVVAHS